MRRRLGPRASWPMPPGHRLAGNHLFLLIEEGNLQLYVLIGVRWDGGQHDMTGSTYRGTATTIEDQDREAL